MSKQNRIKSKKETLSRNGVHLLSFLDADKRGEERAEEEGGGKGRAEEEGGGKERGEERVEERRGWRRGQRRVEERGGWRRGEMNIRPSVPRCPTTLTSASTQRCPSEQPAGRENSQLACRHHLSRDTYLLL